jgi:ubiquinol-cytochrome c reductase cytochrome c subunit
MRIALTAALATALLVPSALAGGPKQGVVTNVGRSGASLYAANCSSCHGPAGQGVAESTRGPGGVEAQGPPLVGVGALSADFYLRTGYMPLGDPHAQPSRSRVLFDDRQVQAITAFVATLGAGPAIPTQRHGSITSGMRLFTDHCAGCHQQVARGGYVTGARVPPLDKATARQVAEAVRIGPYLMPRFSPTAISDRQLDDIVAYVQYARHPDDRGGWSIGNLGPWPEGMVAWLVAVVALVFTCTLLGRRLRS